MQHRKYPPLLVGNRYDMIVILEILPRQKCVIRCDCGVTKEAWTGNITSGRQGSCGCQQRVKRRARRTMGESTALTQAWR